MLKRAAQTASRLLLVLALCGPGGMAAAQQSRVPVTFQINDSLVKDKVLSGVVVGIVQRARGPSLARGKTDAAGKLILSLVPGSYLVSYRLAGYVPIEGSPLQVGPEGKLVTTTLSMMLESSGQDGKRRIQIVLNWGSKRAQVRDADSHLECPCGKHKPHVYFSEKKHQSADHSATLDVDDTDWGGPETITLLDPPPGSYRYWVHNYSGRSSRLGDSEVVVRVIFGDKLAGEFAVPPETKNREWQPFKALVVDPLLEPRIIPYTRAELAAGKQQRQPPASTDDPERALWGRIGALVGLLLGIVAVLVVVLFIRRRQQ